jgi:hypothetical protein
MNEEPSSLLPQTPPLRLSSSQASVSPVNILARINEHHKSYVTAFTGAKKFKRIGHCLEKGLASPLESVAFVASKEAGHHWTQARRVIPSLAQPPNTCRSRTADSLIPWLARKAVYSIEFCSQSLNSGAVECVVTPYRESLPRPGYNNSPFLLLSSAVCRL